MALTFVKVKRRIMAGEEKDSEKVFAQAKSTGVTKMDRLCSLISARSTVSSADVKSVLDSLAWIVDLELKEGKIVQLNDLGTFRMSLRSRGADTEKEFTVHHIKQARILFTPCSTLQQTCNNVTFEPYQVKTVEVEAECDKVHVE